MASRATLAQRLINEGLESAYLQLYSYDPNVRTPFYETLAALKDLELRSFLGLLHGTQENVISFQQEVPVGSFDLKSWASLAESAELGNLLRRTAAQAETGFRAAAEQICTPLNEQLLGLINTSDRDIYDKQSRFRSVHTELSRLQTKDGA